MSLKLLICIEMSLSRPPIGTDMRRFRIGSQFCLSRLCSQPSTQASVPARFNPSLGESLSRTCSMRSLAPCHKRRAPCMAVVWFHPSMLASIALFHRWHGRPLLGRAARSSPEAAPRRALRAGLEGEGADRAILCPPLDNGLDRYSRGRPLIGWAVDLAC
jgi:hypothetical protein